MHSKEATLHDEGSAIIERLRGTIPADIRSAAFEAAACKMVPAVPYLVELVRHPHSGVQEAAEEALGAIRGRETVLALIPLLRSESTPERNCAIHVLSTIGHDDPETILSLMDDPEPNVRLFAAEILGVLRYPWALEPLVRVLEHDPEVNVRHQAAVALGMLEDPAAAPALARAMGDEEWVQFAAVEALAMIRAESSLDALMQALESCSELVASMIIEAFGEIRHHRTLEFLLDQLDTASPALQNKAVKALVGMLGESVYTLRADKRELFRHALLEALEDDDPEVFRAALKGLSGLGSVEATRKVMERGVRFDPDAEPELAEECIRCLVGMGFNSALTQALRSPRREEANLALRACCGFADASPADAVISIFDSLDRDGRRMAGFYLARHAPLDQVPFFRKLLDTKDTDAHLHKAALQFLGTKARDGDSGARMLSFLRHPYNDVKEAALDACLALNDPVVNDGLVALAQDCDVLMRMIGVYAMGRLGAEGFLHELGRALRDPEPQVRKTALNALALEPRRLKNRLGTLLPCLRDASSEVRMAMVDILSRCSLPEAEELVAKALEDPDDWVCIRAVEALCQKLREKAAPYLMPLLEKNRVMVLIKVIEVLGEVGDASVVNMLSGYLSHPEHDVRRAATVALSQLVRQGGEV